MLRSFLPSVVSYSALEGVEVCVADNASTDDSCAIVTNDFPTVRLIRLSGNYGFAEGYNRALQEIEAEYSLLLNLDVEDTEGGLSPLSYYMDNNLQQAACQPKILCQCDNTVFDDADAGCC